MYHRIRQLKVLLGVGAVACFVAGMGASDASAADLVVRGGQLVGATDVNVSGTLYDVAFLDGSCSDLFGLCDTLSDFTFQTEAAALAASVALITQVFLDVGPSFDTNPFLTNGCEAFASVCDVVTPYGFVGPLFPTLRLVAVSVNSPGGGDFTTTDVEQNSGPLAGGSLATWAVWTPVPVPGVNAEWTVRGGQLVGAIDVDVNGTLYDVAFLDGSCAALFDGCDSTSDFTFQTQSQAEAAAQALLDQVFLNTPLDFDDEPELTNGCEDPSGCLAATPYVFFAAVSGVGSIDAFNDNLGGDQLSSPTPESRFFDTTADSELTYAVWMPVPEPTSTAMGVAATVLLGTLVRRRDRCRAQRRAGSRLTAQGLFGTGDHHEGSGTAWFRRSRDDLRWCRRG